MQLGVDEVGPDEELLVRPRVFSNGGCAGGDLRRRCRYALRSASQVKKPTRKIIADDRHVVRLARRSGEVRVEQRERRRSSDADAPSSAEPAALASSSRLRAAATQQEQRSTRRAVNERSAGRRRKLMTSLDEVHDVHRSLRSTAAPRCRRPCGRARSERPSGSPPPAGWPRSAARRSAAASLSPTKRPPRSAKRASSPAWISRDVAQFEQAATPGPSCPSTAWRGPCCEPTVMAQMASWSHGSR